MCVPMCVCGWGIGVGGLSQPSSCLPSLSPFPLSPPLPRLNPTAEKVRKKENPSFNPSFFRAISFILLLLISMKTFLWGTELRCSKKSANPFVVLGWRPETFQLPPLVEFFIHGLKTHRIVSTVPCFAHLGIFQWTFQGVWIHLTCIAAFQRSRI